MSDTQVGRMRTEDFAGLVDRFIAERSGEDDRLPGSIFFELLDHAERSATSPPRDAERVTVTARVLNGQLSLSAPPGAPVRTDGNRVSWGNGYEVVIELDHAA